MVFPSIPYLDPSNWQQQPNQQQAATTNASSSRLLIPPPPGPPPPPPLQPHGSGCVGSIRPGSMTERARLANIPMPEAALKCPRCESTNTKFCYFNNYSLSQPRHFCKTCRRYWTSGGALRSVPVGGGCRRNKRSKGMSSSKSPATSSHDGPTGSGSSSSVSSGANIDILGLGGGAHQQLSQLRFMSPALQHLSHDQFSSGDHIGLSSYGGSIQSSDHHHHLNFQVGSTNTLANVGTLFGGNSLLSIGGGTNLDQTWRIQQGHHPFPFLGGGLDTSSCSGYGSGLYPFEGGSEPSGYGNVRPKTSTSGLSTQLASVKMEDNNNNTNQEISMSSSRHFLGLQGNDQQYWTTGTGTGTTNAWTDLSNFSSSSTSNNQL